MKNPTRALQRLGALTLLIFVPAAATMSVPNEGSGIETGFALGISGAAMSCDFGFASLGGFKFSTGLAATNPWSALAPAAELRIGASVSPWRSGIIRIGSSALAGVAKVPGVGLAAPYGGCALSCDFPLGRSGFSIRAEALARFGGREYAVVATNPAGTVRYVESWAPALADLQVGLRWKPKE